MTLLQEIDRLPRPCVLCIVTHISGGSPGKPGFKMAVLPDGSIRGTVGGGDVESRVIETALSMIQRGVRTKTETYALGQENQAPEGGKQQTSMLCGGEATVYFELLEHARRALVFGAGHIGQSLVPLLLELGFSVEVFDNRPEYTSAGRFPSSVVARCGEYGALAAEAIVDDSTYCFIFTHGHAHDRTVLENLLRKHDALDPQGRPRFAGRYVGMIGSRVKVREILKAIQEKGIPKEITEQVFTPIGLDLGGDSPFEIALCIVAEIQAVRFGRKQVHMRDTH